MKRALRLRPACQCTCEDSTDDDDKAESSEDEVPHYDSKEDGTIPVSFHTLSPEFAEEQIHSSRARNVIDVFPGQGDIAIACLNMGVGCFCICHSEKQREFIMQRLESRAAELAKEPIPFMGPTPSHWPHSEIGPRTPPGTPPADKPFFINGDFKMQLNLMNEG